MRDFLADLKRFEGVYAEFSRRYFVVGRLNQWLGEPSEQELRDPVTRAAYQSFMKAAREVYLGWKDPTKGAVFSIQMPKPDRSNYVFKNGKSQGVPSEHSVRPLQQHLHWWASAFADRLAEYVLGQVA